MTTARETDEALSRRVAEVAGWRIGDSTIAGLVVLIDPRGEHRSNALSGKFEHLCWHNIPKFAESIDAIAALEREAGLRVDVFWALDKCHATAFEGSTATVAGKGSDGDPDHAEPRARSLAYLTWTASTKH